MQRGLIFFAVVMAVVIFCERYSTAQSSLMVFTCVGANTTSACANGDTSLREENSSTPPKYVSVSGFYNTSDGGEGDFQRLGSTQGSGAVCVTVPNSTNWQGTPGSPTITNAGGVPSGLTIGENASGTGTNIQIQPGSEIASVNPTASPPSVTLTLPLTGTASAGTSVTVTFTGDNGGTLIVDKGNDCYQKTNYRGEPHEWGAKGDGSTNDTTPLQNWLGAYGNASNLPTNTTPTNFGPWIATIPANYRVFSSLTCPNYAHIQSSADIISGIPGTGGAGKPPVKISVDPSFNDTLGQPALLTAYPYCRISGIALDAAGIGANYFGPSGSVAASTSGTTTVTINNSNPVPSWVVAGVPINDSGTGGGKCIPAGAAVTGVSGQSITIVSPFNQNIGGCGSMGSGDTITITGFYTVDVIGTHVGIDDHSLIERGYDNVHCADTQVDSLQITNSQIYQAWNTGVRITGNCDNVRLTGDIFENNGGYLNSNPQPPIIAGILGAGVSFTGSDITIADGIIEGSGGPGLSISGAKYAITSDMVFAGNSLGETLNGSSFQAPQIGIANATDITLTGNRFQGGGSDGTINSELLFSGTLNNITSSNNVYTANSGGNDANVRPSFIYDVFGTPTLTNAHLYETPERPALAIFSGTIAQSLLQPLLIPQFTNNQLSGLTLSNDSNAQAVDIAPGSAADSTNSTLMTLPSRCVVNLASGTNGPNGLDTGSVHASTTYYIFLIAAAGGGTTSTPSCMASTSLTPAFTASAFTGTGYVLATKGAPASGSSTVLNLRSLAGVAVGDAIASTDSAVAPTTIAGFSANTGPATAPTVTSATTFPTETIPVSSLSGIQLGMAVLDSAGCIPGNAYVTNIINSPPPVEIQISQNTTCNEPVNTTLSISGAFQVVLNGTASATEYLDNLNISTGYYRLVGALYTDGSSNVVQFTQDGDTFTLDVPVNDINVSGMAANTPLFEPLPSVPNGLRVEAFGRCINGTISGTNYVLPYTAPANPSAPQPGTPAYFPTAPGFSVSTAGTPSIASSFRLYTDTGRNIKAISANSSGTLQCMTDGWVWHRAQ